MDVGVEFAKGFVQSMLARPMVSKRLTDGAMPAPT
jgi:hypothetical protein